MTGNICSNNIPKQSFYGIASTRLSLRDLIISVCSICVCCDFPSCPHRLPIVRLSHIWLDGFDVFLRCIDFPPPEMPTFILWTNHTYTLSSLCRYHDNVWPCPVHKLETWFGFYWSISTFYIQFSCQNNTVYYFRDFDYDFPKFLLSIWYLGKGKIMTY